MRARVPEPYLHLHSADYKHGVRCSSKSKRTTKDRRYVDCPKCLALFTASFSDGTNTENAGHTTIGKPPPLPTNEEFTIVLSAGRVKS